MLPPIPNQHNIVHHPSLICLRKKRQLPVIVGRQKIDVLVSNLICGVRDSPAKNTGILTIDICRREPDQSQLLNVADHRLGFDAIKHSTRLVSHRYGDCVLPMHGGAFLVEMGHGIEVSSC